MQRLQRVYYRSRERDEAELTDLRDQLLEARTDNATVLQVDFFPYSFLFLSHLSI